MSRKLKRTFQSIFFLILFSSIIYAQAPPFEETQTADEENHLTIVFPKSIYMPFGEPGILNFDILNSTLHRLDNITASCIYATAHHHGRIIDQGNLSYNEFWFMDIPLTTYSEPGVYNYYVYCNTTAENGYISASIILTRTGEEIDHRFNYAVLGGIFILLFILIAFMHAFKKDEGAVMVYGSLGATISFLTIWAYVFGVLYLSPALRYFVMAIFAGLGIYFTTMSIFFKKELNKE